MYRGPPGCLIAGGVPGGMGQAIWPGDRAALTPLPVLTLLMLPLLSLGLAVGMRRASGGSCWGRGERTGGGESTLAGESGEAGDGVNAPLLVAE